jgi:hypothetical protein
MLELALSGSDPSGVGNVTGDYRFVGPKPNLPAQMIRGFRLARDETDKLGRSHLDSGLSFRS